MMRKQNFKSDFGFLLTLQDEAGQTVTGVADNWELTLKTANSGQLVYKASYGYGDYFNCKADADGKITIAVDNHKLPAGELLYDFAIDIKDEAFPDGNRHVYVSGSTQIELVNENIQQLDGVEVIIKVPYLKAKAEEESGSEKVTE